MRRFKAVAHPCKLCPRAFKSPSGLTRHIDDKHRAPTAPPPPVHFAPPPPPPPLEDDQIQPPSPGGGEDFQRAPSPPPSPVQPPHRVGTETIYHSIIDGTPCDHEGFDLPAGTPPPPWDERAANDFKPFQNRAHFELAEFLYRDEEMAGARVDRLSQLLAAYYNTTSPPFADHRDLYEHIDAIPQGDIPWESFSVKYTGPVPAMDPPAWMMETYEVWFRSPLAIFEQQLANPDFKDEMDWAPKRIFRDSKRQFVDLLSGNWAWKQADEIAKDPETHGAMFVPCVLGSDKTTVSVGTGNTEFYPFYGGIGNIYNSTRRAHRNGLALLAFLAIPKTTRDHAASVPFRKFRRQLFHSSLHRVLLPLKEYMTKARITRCADQYFRRVIYGLGPYIADYPEQALLACIVQNWCTRCFARPENLDAPSTGRTAEEVEALLDAFSLKDLWDEFGIVGDLIPFTSGFPRADIHELLTMDLLHQIIKGTFKDHIVDWVHQHIAAIHPNAEALRILADIDRRIAATTPFPGLRHFHTGRGYKQWTGNDSKGLMKVYLPAIAGHVSSEVVRTVSAVIEFCYLVRRDVISELTLEAVDTTVIDFHRYREVFRPTVRPDGFSLPRQHSMVHWRPLIQLFGAPNGVCSSITESKHIKAVKKPYRRSNHNKPLSQMLLTNQRLDKLATARVDFEERGMLDGSLFPFPPPPPRVPGSDALATPAPNPDNDSNDGGEVDGPTTTATIKLAKHYCIFLLPVRKVPRDVHELARYMDQPLLHELIRRFLYDVQNPGADIPGSHVDPAHCPPFASKVYMYSSARAIFHAPSDISGVGGMRFERIRATKSWYGGAPRYDCVFLPQNNGLAGFRGLRAARVFMFFRFKYDGVQYPCALIHWHVTRGREPDPDTRMWVVAPEEWRGGYGRRLEVVYLDRIFRGAHLVGMAGREFLPIDFTFSDSLDGFKAFYVNKYADHHAHEIAF
ncbi:hypothetical protein GGX14DRAFT_375923 [Mycena pura]|uniref:C2H2-type domain-containing protein n=1 Tax=Mycena pura TaxID=153505 RepID=A0AAD6UYN3_9AGAR|nr:hypothetical protein GGX14DRAFT_375923 [Mycena pura]